MVLELTEEQYLNEPWVEPWCDRWDRLIERTKDRCTDIRSSDKEKLREQQRALCEEVANKSRMLEREKRVFLILVFRHIDKYNKIREMLYGERDTGRVD